MKNSLQLLLQHTKMFSEFWNIRNCHWRFFLLPHQV